MKVGILYICTGRYSIFWKDFYVSCETNFLKEIPKHYFVFTDSETLEYSENANVHLKFQEKLGWPYDTLDRFKIFSKVEDELKNFDYLFFFNANALIKKPVTEDLLKGNYSLIGAKHPCYFNKDNLKFSYERNPESKAYVKPGDGLNYYVGGFNGGKSVAYLSMISELNRRIEDDKLNNIIAVWHDESHLNKYYFEHQDQVKTLSPAYMYPEEMKIPFERIIIVRSKKKLGGHNYLRGISDDKKTTLGIKLDKWYKSLFS